MSIFSKRVSQIETSDLAALIEGEAVENIRLEFKREPPKKDEVAKKVSAFANTYGGLIIVGAEADSSDGRLVALPGVEKQPSYKQTIVQWCADAIAPLVDVDVSEAVPTPGDPGKFCYLVDVRESDLAPHFLNGRKGVYVRTNEYSTRFEPKFANESEIRHLLDRRRLVEERKERLLDRANTRFRNHIALNYQKMSKKEGWIGAQLKVAVLPRYPSNPLYEIDKLIEHVMTKAVNWRQVGFPRESYGVLSQHESAIVLGPGSVFSMLEANIWGLHFYATEIERKAETYQGIHLGHLLGHVLVFLEHSRTLLGHSGYSGTLTIQVVLDGICGVPLVYFEANEPQKGPHSELDDQVSFSLEIGADDLQNHRDRVAMDLLKQIFYVVNWPDMAGSLQGMQMRIKEGYKYNMWNPSNLSL